MRRLRLAVGIRHRTGLDGVERKLALGPGAAAAKTLERRIRQRAVVLRIGEAALGVGLPDLQHAVGHESAVAVIDKTFDADPIARSVGGDEIAGEGVIPLVLAVRRQPVGDVGADGLRWRDLRPYLVPIAVALSP